MCAFIFWFGLSLFYFGVSVLLKRYICRTQVAQTQYTWGFPTVGNVGTMCSLGH